MELVYMRDSKSRGATRVGSTPTSGTMLEKLMPRAGFARARLVNRNDFSGQKEIPDSI